MDSNKKLVRNCNRLARKFYKMQGYEVPKSFHFYDSTHPHEISLWNEAMVAYEHIRGSDVQDALDEMREDQREKEASNG